jgi:hypothetical protein
LPAIRDLTLPPWLILVLVLLLGTFGLLARRDPAGGWRGGGLASGSEGSDAHAANTSDLLQSYPGLARPEVLPASEAKLGDDDEVIGVVIEGRARAYPVRAMNRPQSHVVNDIIGSAAVSVTYCDIERCARAFTREGATGPLELAVGGQHHARGLLLMVDGERFDQSTQQPYGPGAASRTFPYQGLPVTVTSWRAWRERHPDTEVSRPSADPSARPLPAGVEKTPSQAADAGQDGPISPGRRAEDQKNRRR